MTRRGMRVSFASSCLVFCLLLFGLGFRSAGASSAAKKHSPNNDDATGNTAQCFHANAKGRRSSNEDETLCAEVVVVDDDDDVFRRRGVLAAVFDGHDGNYVSREARRRLARRVERRLGRGENDDDDNDDDDNDATKLPASDDRDRNDDIGTAMEKEEKRERWALETALRDVHETIEKEMSSSTSSTTTDGAGGGGSTALVALVSPDFSRASFAWVGDSRAYACENIRNEAKLITRDHTVRASSEEAERVRKAGGVVIGDRAEGILVTRALGDFESRGVGGARAETRTVRLKEFAERWDEEEEGREESSDRDFQYSSNPRERAEEIRRKRRGGSSGDKEKEYSSRSMASSSSSSTTRNGRVRRSIRGIVLVSDGVIEKAEDDGGSGRFMNELCEILFGDVETTTVRRRIKRRRSHLETTTIALKPLPNHQMRDAQDEKGTDKETTPEDDEAFTRNKQPPENDIPNIDLVELKVDGDVELEPDEKVLPIEAWADIRSFGENSDMAKNARLSCEMAIAMGSKDNVAVAAIKFPDSPEEPMLNANDDEKEETTEEEEEKKEKSAYDEIETPRTESENHLTVADQRRDDGRFLLIDPKPGVVIANAFRLNEIVALSNGPIKNYQHNVLRGYDTDEMEERGGSDIAPAQKYVVGGEGYQSYSKAIEIPWNVDVYQYGEYFDFDGSYFSSVSGALPEANGAGEAEKQMIKMTDADKAFAMLMIAPSALHERRKKNGMKMQTPPPDGILSKWWLRAKNGISSALFSSKPAEKDGNERESKEEVMLVPPSTSAQHEDATRSNSKRVFAKGHFGEVWRATAFDVGTLTPQCRPSAKEERRESNPNLSEARDASSSFVIKRIFVERGEDVRRSGSREMYFGNLFCDVTPNVARFHRAFETTTTTSESSPSEEKELWLAFRDEGTSLDRLMYEEDRGGMLRPSKWWIEQRKIADENGKRTKNDILDGNRNETSGKSRDDKNSTAPPSSPKRDALREILLEIARGVAKVHQSNVAHRDIKPANIFIAFEGDDGTSPSFHSSPTSTAAVSDVRIGDFGSAVDAGSFDTLFGPLGPNSDQETPDFAPPESLFRAKSEHPEQHTLSSFDIKKYKMYDAWSLGIVYLEVLALGTSRVWDDNGFATTGNAGKRERLRRDESLRDASAETQLAYNRIRAMLSMCIAPSYANFGVNSGVESGVRNDAKNPRPSESNEQNEDEKEERDEHNNGGVYSGACLEENIMRRIKLRDPLHLGLPNAWALRLIRRLLQWTPDRRLDVARIEKHAFFKERIDEVSGESFFANEGWTCPSDASGFVYEFSDECAERCKSAQCV